MSQSQRCLYPDVPPMLAAFLMRFFPELPLETPEIQPQFLRYLLDLILAQQYTLAI